MTPLPDYKHAAAAVVILFTTQPTDRALTGWCLGDWLGEELAELELAERIA